MQESKSMLTSAIHYYIGTKTQVVTTEGTEDTFHRTLLYNRLGNIHWVGRESSKL